MFKRTPDNGLSVAKKLLMPGLAVVLVLSGCGSSNNNNSNAFIDPVDPVDPVDTVPSFDSATGILNLPTVEITNNGVIETFAVKIKFNSDGSFEIISCVLTN